MHFKSYKVRLEPNNRQRSQFAQHAGVARHAYNAGLNYCIASYDKEKKTPSAITMHKWLVAEVKSKFPWYYKASKFSSQQALRNLEVSFKNFHLYQKKYGYKNYRFKIVNGKKKIVGLKGLPKFKKKGRNDRFYLEGKILIEKNKIKLPKIGWVKLSEAVPVDEIKNCTISKIADHWYLAFKTEVQTNHTEKKHQAVGVDLGVKQLAVLSNGETFENLKPYKNAKLKIRRDQKAVARKFMKGAENQSANYKKSCLKLAKTHNRVANIRINNIHKITSYLAKNFESVTIENLRVHNMSKNHKLASAILDGGFYEFKRQLLYKKSWYGGKVIIANSFFASSKTCSNCGAIKKELTLDQRVYNCNYCHYRQDRDLNAAINLENLEVSSTLTAFGDESSADSFKPTAQLVDELGRKHQVFNFE